MGEQAKKARKGDPKSVANASKARKGNVTTQPKPGVTARKGNKNLPQNPNAKKGKP
jgi:hypothetical protein